MHGPIRVVSFPGPALIDRRFAILVTCYMTGSTEGRNLGRGGYSYDFVARLFQPLLARWGEVVSIQDARRDLQPAVRDARAQGLEPVHVSFLPFQDVVLAQDAPNVVVPAWEFPDVPDHEFDNNPQNNWPATADRCDLVLVGGPFTVDALRRGGAKVPIRVVPVPTPDAYFALEPWQCSQEVTIDCAAYCFPQPGLSRWDGKPSLSRKYELKQAGKALEKTLRHLNRALLGPKHYARLSDSVKSGVQTARHHLSGHDLGPPHIALPYACQSSLQLSGIVYTSIFNPDDSRKNWQDLLTGFLLGLRDCEDATLVVKLITRKSLSVEQVVEYYRTRDIAHRCRLVVICDFLSDKQMLQLARATTYYAQTSRGEGNCLPLMNALAAGRPGVTPAHSAMSDYFDDSMGFVIDSHPEPSAWPHDERLRTRTTWGRIVWSSVRDQFRASYELVKSHPARYAELAQRCRARMREWAGYEAVWTRLSAALHDLAQGSLADCDEHGTPHSQPKHQPQRRAA